MPADAEHWGGPEVAGDLPLHKFGISEFMLTIR
jgi:hypothetical protein